MLETPAERIKLLRAGFTSKTIEKLYIEGNNFKFVRFPVIVELGETIEQQFTYETDSKIAYDLRKTASTC